MSNTRELEQIIGRALKGEGFLKKAGAWYRHTPETVLVVDLQKSEWGGQYHVNLAVLVRQLDETEFPGEAQCHLRVRFNRLVERADELERLLDLEDPIVAAPERRKRLNALVRDQALPFLHSVETLDGLASLMRSNEWLRNRAVVSLRSLVLPEDREGGKDGT